jgi:hypothetical protein
VKTPLFIWSLLISIIIHSLFFLHWVLAIRRERPAVAIFETKLLASPLSFSSDEPTPPVNEGRAPRRKSFPQQQQQKPSPLHGNSGADQPKFSDGSDENSSSSAGVTASQPNGEGTASTGVGTPSTDGGGGAGTGGTFFGQQGKGSSTQRKAGAGGTAPSTASMPIPEPPIHRYRVYGTYFTQVDHYVIQDRSIPGTELCIAGDQLRTIEPITLTEINTDYSKCRVRTRRDREWDICPPEATSETVVFRGYLSSPLTYTVNTCRQYDKSHCTIVRRGTEKEREVCRVDFKYEGVWDSATLYDYRCVSFDVVTYTHPLEFTIRYKVDIPKAGDRYIQREVHRVKQSIPQC